MSDRALVHKVITEKFIDLMSQGVIPWRQTWIDQAGAISYATRKAYNGVNLFMLSWKAVFSGYTSPYWMTYAEAQKQGGQVKRGEKSMPIHHVQRSGYHKKGEPDDAPLHMSWTERWWNVFNLDQLEGVEVPKLNEKIVVPPEDVMKWFEAIPGRAKLAHGNPAYSPSHDTVYMPTPSQFKAAEYYCDARFHEETHSTGHESRLNRPNVTNHIRFGSGGYGQEELVATLAQAMLMNHFGLEMPDVEVNTVAYLQNWSKAIKADHEMVISAGSQASKAVKWLLGERDETDTMVSETTVTVAD